MKTKEIFKNIFFSILIVAIFFGGLELFQRVRYYLKHGEKSYLLYGLCGAKYTKTTDFYGDIPFTKYKGYYKCKPGEYPRSYRGRTFPVYINSFGLRGEDIEMTKEDDIFRIIMVGGSSTQGLESPDNQTIPAVLQHLLNTKGKPFLSGINKKKAQVINAGMCGHSTRAILVMLQNELLQLKPDLILFYSGFNDYRHSELFGRQALRNNLLLKVCGEKIIDFLRRHSLLFESIYEKMTLFAKSKVSLEVVEDIVSLYKSNVTKIIRITRAHNIKLAIAKQPIFIEDYPMLQDSKKVKALLEKIESEHKIECVDAYYLAHSLELGALDEIASGRKILLIDPIAEMYQPRNPDLFYDIVHLSEKGNEKLAHIIFQGLTTSSTLSS